MIGVLKVTQLKTLHTWAWKPGSLAASAVLLACPLTLGEKVQSTSDVSILQCLLCLLTDSLCEIRLAAEAGRPYSAFFHAGSLRDRIRVEEKLDREAAGLKHSEGLLGSYSFPPSSFLSIFS